MKRKRLLPSSFPYPQNRLHHIKNIRIKPGNTPRPSWVCPLTRKLPRKMPSMIGREGSFFHQSESTVIRRPQRYTSLLRPIFLTSASPLLFLVKSPPRSTIRSSKPISALTGIDVKIRSGETGRELDQTATLQKIRGLMETMQSGTIDLVVKTTEPAVMDVEKTGADCEKRCFPPPYDVHASPIRRRTRTLEY